MGTFTLNCINATIVYQNYSPWRWPSRVETFRRLIRIKIIYILVHYLAFIISHDTVHGHGKHWVCILFLYDNWVDKHLVEMKIVCYDTCWSWRRFWACFQNCKLLVILHFELKLFSSMLHEVKAPSEYAAKRLWIECCALIRSRWCRIA
jgi:hypothetical protein